MRDESMKGTVIPGNRNGRMLNDTVLFSSYSFHTDGILTTDGLPHSLSASDTNDMNIFA